jgi:hypothetical protein
MHFLMSEVRGKNYLASGEGVKFYPQEVLGRLWGPMTGRMNLIATCSLISTFLMLFLLLLAVASQRYYQWLLSMPRSIIRKKPIVCFTKELNLN